MSVDLDKAIEDCDKLIDFMDSLGIDNPLQDLATCALLISTGICSIKEFNRNADVDAALESTIKLIRSTVKNMMEEGISSVSEGSSAIN